MTDEATIRRVRLRRAYEGWEEDMYPNICAQCWKQSTRRNPVHLDEHSGRNYCRECDPVDRVTGKKR